jgi:prefoldin subunit 4
VCVAWLQKKLEDLEDAGNELMLADDESVRYVSGECFIHIPKETAEERLQKLSETVTKEKEEYEGRMETTSERMKELKAILYGKFGSSINL